ncbi:MAG: hypothetical protein BMS9Abin36_1561 [Gammaproteobacteria bacterium]|nr:MAG: hypothetical protein BMS9Abin36_1561 [Gammaproteobacteria bacterium]
MKQLNSISPPGGVRRALATVSLLLASVFVMPQVLAATGAGALIFNTVQVDWQDASGSTSFAETATASVTVSLVASAATLTAPIDQTVASGATAAYAYTITSTANGSDTYTFSVPASTPTNLDGTETATFSVASVILGASVISGVTAADTFQVPAGSETNLTAADIVIIGGVDYAVVSVTAGTQASHNNPSGTDGVAGVTTAESPTAIQIGANVAGSNVAPALAGGDIGSGVFEQGIFTLNVTGTVSGVSDGTFSVTARATSAAPASLQTDDVTLTTFTASALTIAKVASAATAVTGDTVTYTITVTNTGSGNATNVTLTDAVPAYTTYVANSTLLNGITVSGDGAASPLAGGLLIDDDGARGAGVVASGNIAGGNSATITFNVTVN